jgi:hypothetical protein
VSDVSTAVMVMEFGAGGNSGAEYIPFAAMVPNVAFPPAIPLTDQFTAGFEPSPVFAVNCCCATPGMEALDGVTVNAVSPGPPAAPVSPGKIAWAQPPSNTASTANITSTERFKVFPPSIPTLLAARPHLLRQSRRAFQIATGLMLEGYGNRSIGSTGHMARFGATVPLFQQWSNCRFVCSLAKQAAEKVFPRFFSLRAKRGISFSFL